MTELDLSSELVVISGAAGGLGRLVCGRLAVLGADVVAVDLIDDLVPPIGHDGDRGEGDGARRQPGVRDVQFLLLHATSPNQVNGSKRYPEMQRSVDRYLPPYSQTRDSFEVLSGN